MNIYDYIEYYKGYSFKEIEFNEVDALLFSIISYLTIDSIDNESNFNDLNNILKVNENTKGIMERSTERIISLIYNSNRYNDIKIYNYVNIENTDLQFSAFTLRCDYFTYIIYWL